MFKLLSNNKELELKELLEKYKYLTSDSFQSPDRTYILLDKNVIKFVDFGDTMYNFNLERYGNISFREVKKIYEIVNF